MQLRVGRVPDVPGAVEVWRAGRAAAGSRPSRAELDRVHEQLAAPDGLCVVLLDPDRDGVELPAGGPVVGVALGGWRGPAGELTPDHLHLALLAVDPALRRRGLGTQLLEGLADEAYVRGARQLSSRGCTPEVAAFLAACGLRQDGPVGGWSAELDPPMHELAVAPGIRLGQLLKLAGLVDTGAQAKALLAAGGVQVNGELELRRGRQLAAGDVVVARDRAVQVAPG